MTSHITGAETFLAPLFRLTGFIPWIATWSSTQPKAWNPAVRCCHASCMCYMIYNIYMPRKGTEWHVVGAVKKQVWCLRCLQNQAVTTRSGSSLGPNCARRPCTAPCDVFDRRNHRGGAWVSGLWMVTRMFEAQVAQVHSGSFRFAVRHHRVWTSLAMMSLDAVLTYQMTHKLRTSQCVKMTAWEASGRCWDIEPGLMLNLGEGRRISWSNPLKILKHFPNGLQEWI